VIIDAPVPFPGTAEQAIANAYTHVFDDDPDTRCMNCDCRPSHVAASYPFGEEPPRYVRCTECERGVAHEHTPAQQAMLDAYKE